MLGGARSAKLGLLDGPAGRMPVCTDTTSRPLLKARHHTLPRCTLPRRGGHRDRRWLPCASVYLGAWAISRTVGIEAARGAVDDVAPLGEKDATVAKVFAAIGSACGSGRGAWRLSGKQPPGGCQGSDLDDTPLS